MQVDLQERTIEEGTAEAALHALGVLQRALSPTEASPQHPTGNKQHTTGNNKQP